MATLIHGTTSKGFKAIINGEGKAGLHNPWSVSDNDGMMYFFDAEQILSECGFDEESEAIAQGVNQAFEQARLQWACRGEAGDIVVMVCDVPDDIVEVDTSCPNMEHCRMIPCGSFNESMIKRVFTGSMDIWEVPSILGCVLGNDIFNTYELPEKLLSLAERIGFDDDIYSYDVDETTLSDAKMRFA